ncbi:MAG: PQQ-like beta-propeller repeat protein [Planctomycetes bacterium]|nr:PQQ-like beta-propeller repeat protein [Planctomycetota bacterium]
MLHACTHLALLASAVLPAVLAGDGQDWPCWRGPERDGVSRESGWSSSGKEADLWRVEVGRGYSCVAVANGKLVAKGFDEVTGMDVVRCLDPLSGEQHWIHAYPSKLWDNMHEGGTLTTPVIDGERVFVLSRLGNFQCLAVATGKVLFERALIEGEKGLGPFGLVTSPLVLADKVVLNVGRTMALDKTNGKTLWETRDYGHSYAVPAPFEYEGKKLLAVFNGAGLVVLDQQDGGELALHPWTSEYNVNSATPIVIGRRIFLSTGYNAKGCAMLEFTGKALEVLWENKEMNSNMNGCVLLDGHLYGFDDAVLKCLTIDGDVRWAERGLGKGTVVASDGRLIVLSEKGELLVAPATPKGFEPASRARLFDDGVCWTTPVLSHGIFYCRNNRGQLVARDHRAVQ